MDNLPKIKNVINNNDFFKLRKSDDDNHKRIYDIEAFYQKKYNNNNINKYNNNNSRNNIFNNGVQNISLIRNQNYFPDNNNNNNNNNFDSIFSNDIEAENNIGKYKDKIINRSNIVEQNYKKFTEYQNQRYNRLNIKYTKDLMNEDNNNRYNNNNNVESIKNNDFFYNQMNKEKTPNIYSRNGRINNKINRSNSTGNIFQNKFYLSEYENYDPHLNNAYRNGYMGKKKTDITNSELINMQDNNKNGFYDYYNKKMEISLDNKKMIEDKLNQKKNNIQNSKIKEQNEIKIKNIYFNNLSTQNLLDLKNSKIKYKNLLDEQVKNNINNKLLNENMTFGDVVQSQIYLHKKNNIPDRNFLNKNKFVEINPYNHRNYSLGDSHLKNNIIINPQVQYKYNRYLFPQIPLNK